MWNRFLTQCSFEFGQPKIVFNLIILFFFILIIKWGLPNYIKIIGYEIPPYGWGEITIDYNGVPIHGKDFEFFYQGSRNLLNGKDIFAIGGVNHTSKEAREAKGYHDGQDYAFNPFYAYFYSPFSTINYKYSYLAWTTLILVALLVAILFTSLLTPFPVSSFISAAVLIFSSEFLYFHIERGQNDILVIALVILSFYGYSKKWPGWIIALLIVLAGMLKWIPLVILFYFFVKKEWKIITTIMAFLIIIILTTGINNWNNHFFDSIVNIAQSTTAFGQLYCDNSFSSFISHVLELPRKLSFTLSHAVFALSLLYYFLINMIKKERIIPIYYDLVFFSILMCFFITISFNYKMVFLVPFLALGPALVNKLKSFAYYSIYVLVYGSYFFIVALDSYYWPNRFILKKYFISPVLNNQFTAFGVLLAYLTIVLLLLKLKKENKHYA